MTINRRQFLGSALAVPLTLRSQAAPSSTLVDKGFARVDRFTDDVSVTFADPSKGPQCLSNGGVIAGRDATLIVEGHFLPQGAELEIATASTLSSKPIVGAVNTHFHLDHTFGNSVYAKAGIPIVAHENAPKLMKAQYGDLKGVDKAPRIAALQKAVDEALGDVERTRRQANLGAFQWMYGAIDQVELAYPTQLLVPSDGPKRMDLGGVTALLECHTAHTPTDVIVHVPDRGIAFVGDLLFHQEYPVSIDADMIEWRNVLDRLSDLAESARLVPGHGPLCGRSDVQAQIDLFDDLRRHAERMLKTGANVDEAMSRYEVPAPFRAYDVWAWGWTVGPAVSSFYDGLRAPR